MNPPTTPMRSFARFMLHAATFGLALAVAASFGGRLHWALDLTTHFRTQYVVAAAVLTIGYAVGRRYRAAMVPLALGLINGWFLMPYYSANDDVSPPPAEAVRLKIVSLNVFADSQAYGDVVAYIRDVKPDFVVFTEVTPAWRAGLRPLDDEYPERHFVARNDPFGIGLIGKRPLKDVRIESLGSQSPYVRATCDIDGRTLRLFGIHPPPPIMPRLAATRNEAFDALSGIVRKVDGPAIVVGDFNSTGWSPHFVDLLTGAELRDSRVGRGLQTSWPMTLPTPLRIPIDHVLVSLEVQVVERRTGPYVGSDHLPVEMEFTLRP